MIEPALTAEEWTDGVQYQYCNECGKLEVSDEPGICHFCRGHNVDLCLVPHVMRWDEKAGRHVEVGDQRALAAHALDGQEWGFTHEDVRRHRAQAAMMRESVERWGDLAGGIAGATAIEESAALSAWHDSVADRLEALLRPEVVELYVKNEVSP